MEKYPRKIIIACECAGKFNFNNDPERQEECIKEAIQYYEASIQHLQATIRGNKRRLKLLEDFVK